MEKVVQVPVSDPPKASVLRRFDTPKKKSRGKLVVAVFAMLAIVAGVGTGWVLAKQGGGSASPESGRIATVEDQNEQEAGSNGENFPDTADGILREGGIDGEGTHHLERGSGPEQYAYLTSSLIDLQGFVGKKVQVWGQTLAGQNAGWLMDVGKIKVIE